MKQLIEDLISTMEYHVEQTRPIHSTTVALQAAREALKSLPAPAQPAPVQEPVAWMHVAAHMPSNRHLEWNENHPGYRGDWIKQPLYTTPPAAQRQWVGLTDEEANELWESTDSDWELMKRTEAKLKEKNT